MRARVVEAFRYRLPLVEPLSMPSGTHVRREGILIRHTAEDGAVGWGEAAPLPGYSPDTLDDVRRYFGAWKRREALALAVSGPGGRASIHTQPSIPRYSPAASWAIVQAGVEQEAARTGRSLAGVYAARCALPRTPAPQVSLNALLLGSRSAVLDAARQSRDEGYQAAKLKLSGLDVEDAASLTTEVGEVLHGGALRVDVNRAWTLHEALAYAQAVDAEVVAYVEEPLADVEELPELARRTSLRWVLDESLGRAVVTPAIAGAIDGAVVKPTLGPLNVWWAESKFQSSGPGPKRQRPVVISSTFESGVGMRHLVALAAALGDTPAGLDTYRWLAEDVLDRPLPIAGPVVDVAAVLAPNDIRPERLEPIAL